MAHRADGSVRAAVSGLLAAILKRRMMKDILVADGAVVDSAVLPALLPSLYNTPGVFTLMYVWCGMKEARRDDLGHSHRVLQFPWV